MLTHDSAYFYRNRIHISMKKIFEKRISLTKYVIPLSVPAS